MKYRVVLPFVYRPFMEACVATMAPEFKKNVFFVDNTLDNIGIMRAHNKGIDRMNRVGADWLIILSAAVRFGEAGGLDFIQQLEDHMDHYVIHAASNNVIGGKQNDGSAGGGVNKIFGWHLTAFKREVFENIGRWDENFSPYGLDDLDLSLRIQKHYKGAKGWDTYPCDVSDTVMSHSINKAGVKAAYPPRESYFRRKWGRGGGDWQNMGYDHPFNDPTKPLSFFPEQDDPLSIWQNEYKGDWRYDD